MFSGKGARAGWCGSRIGFCPSGCLYVVPFSFFVAYYSFENADSLLTRTPKIVGERTVQDVSPGQTRGRGEREEGSLRKGLDDRISHIEWGSQMPGPDSHDVVGTSTETLLRSHKPIWHWKLRPGSRAPGRDMAETKRRGRETRIEPFVGDLTASSHRGQESARLRDGG